MKSRMRTIQKKLTSYLLGIPNVILVALGLSLIFWLNWGFVPNFILSFINRTVS